MSIRMFRPSWNVFSFSPLRPLFAFVSIPHLVLWYLKCISSSCWDTTQCRRIVHNSGCDFGTHRMFLPHFLAKENKAWIRPLAVSQSVVGICPLPHAWAHRSPQLVMKLSREMVWYPSLPGLLAVRWLGWFKLIEQTWQVMYSNAMRSHTYIHNLNVT